MRFILSSLESLQSNSYKIDLLRIFLPASLILSNSYSQDNISARKFSVSLGNFSGKLLRARDLSSTISHYI